jgi:hypothetical protein
MKRGMWIGGLFLSLIGWAGQAGAQEDPWWAAPKPANWGPQPAPAGAAATLGRPTAIRPAAPVYDAGVVAASYHEMMAPTPVPRNLPEVADSPDDAASIWATDRPVRPVIYTSREPVTVPPKPGPAPVAVPPPFVGWLPDADAPLTEGPAAMFAAVGGAMWHGVETVPDRGFYVRGEYLLWWFKKDQTPPLVTTSAPADNGFLTGRTTQIVFGGDLDSGSHSGARFTGGLWLDDCQTKAIEFSGFFVPGDEHSFDANSAFFPVLARPFFSLNRKMEFAQLTAFPTTATGNIHIENASNLWGLEANLRCKLCCGCTECDDAGYGGGLDYRIDGLAGFRYLNLREDLVITENVTNLATAMPPNQPNVHATIFDEFATRNQFYGGQVGLDAVFARGPWSLDVLGKLALGDTHQDININGSQLVTNPATGVTTPFVGGLLALRSNIGSHDRDSFSIVPEVNLTVSYHLNDHWRLFAGYDWLYWTNVVRPGHQIDRQIDESLIPNFEPVAPVGQTHPAVLFKQSDFWAQGLNLGVEFRY